jgi:hypothetical protein
MLVASILASCAIGRPAAQEVAGLNEAVDAIWHVHAIDLHFKSPTTYYYCDILQEKISSILRMVGAGDPMNIRARCSSGALINDTSVRVVVGVPVEATPENVQIETTFDTRMELVARTRNWQLPTPTTIRRFRAAWTTVSFSRMDRLHLTPEDCDLLRDMSEQVFPQLGIRISKDQFYCTPGSTPLGRPRLEVQALIRLPSQS